MLRALLAQTMETLKITRRRVDEQQNYLKLLGQLLTTNLVTGLLNTRSLHLILRRVLARAKREETGRVLIVTIWTVSRRSTTVTDILLGTKSSRMSRDTLWVRCGKAMRSPASRRLMPGISRREADLQASTLSTGLNGLIVPWNGKVIQVSSSVGGACYGPDDDMHTIYRRADEEMYRHKNDSMSIRLASGKHDA